MLQVSQCVDSGGVDSGDMGRFERGRLSRSRVIGTILLAKQSRTLALAGASKVLPVVRWMLAKQSRTLALAGA